MARLTARETVGSTKAHFESLNQRSSTGILYVEEDTGVIRVGDGVSNYRDLLPAGASGYSLGFADYNDTSSAASPVELVANTWTSLPNDGLGPFSQETYLPEGCPTLLGAGGSIDPTGLPLGSKIFIRPDFRVTPNVNNAALKFRYKLGTGVDTYFLESSLGRLDEDAGIAYPFSLNTQYIYMGDNNTKDNPIELQIKLSSNGSVVNAGMVIDVFKRGY